MRAVVIGGGIAGTTTAIALARAGIEAVVHEAYGHDSEGVGAWLTLASNGIDAVGTLGLGEAVRAGGFPTPRMRLVNQNGRTLAEFPFGAERADGLQVHSVRRSELYRAPRARPACRSTASAAPTSTGRCATQPPRGGSPSSTASGWSPRRAPPAACS